MKKALGYARVSGKSQETDGTGLEQQIELCEAWAKANDWQIVEWFKDAYTGEAPWQERPAMRAMVERLALNGIEAIIVHQMDRVARGKSKLFEGFFEIVESRRCRGLVCC